METSTPGTPNSPPVSNTNLNTMDSLSLYVDAAKGDRVGSRLGLSSSSRSCRSTPGDFPPEIIHLILFHLVSALLPSPESIPDPDPYLHLLSRATPYSPLLFEANQAEQLRTTLANVSLVDRTWGAEAQKELWRHVGFGMPKGFESVLRTVGEYRLGLRRSGGDGRDPKQDLIEADCLGRNGEATIEGDERGRSATWTKKTSLESHEDAHSKTSHTLPSTTAVKKDSEHIFLLDPAASPLLRTKSLSFSRFRTAGLRRSVGQGSQERFVTPNRLLSLLRGTRDGNTSLHYPDSSDDMDERKLNSSFSDSGKPSRDLHDALRRRMGRGRLEAVGFSEFMDSAITRPILEELLFRGGYLADYEEDASHLNQKIKKGDSGLEQSLPQETARFRAHLSPSSSQTQTILAPVAAGRISTSVTTTHGGSISAVENSVQAFQARHLQPSLSRSPSGTGQRRSSSISRESIKEATGESSEEDNVALEGEDEPMNQDEEATIDSSSLPLPRHRLHRRHSGAAFAPFPTSGNVDNEERGRERVGRLVQVPGLLDVRASSRGRMKRSLLPPSSFLNRSSSVPAHYQGRNTGFHRPPSLTTDRSSSVPASARRNHAKKIVRVLEGSTEVRSIRALDLCGCVSTAFVAALTDVVSVYNLGPAGLSQSNQSIPLIRERTDETASDNESDDLLDGTSGGHSSTSSDDGYVVCSRRLRRIYFPHLRRLGLAASLLPSPVLAAFVLSFPYLTHLDLTSTFATPIVLKHLSLSGQNGMGGRHMRLKALSLAKCRLLTGSAILGMLCGECPPFTSMAGMEGQDGEETESWGSGEVVADLIDLSLYGDGTYPSPLSTAELRMTITTSPAFLSGRLRTLDLSSCALTDSHLSDHFPLQPNLIELGLANCRFISLKGVAQFLLEKAQSVEVLDISNSCPPTTTLSAVNRSATNGGHMSAMELHSHLLAKVASVNPSSFDPQEAEEMLGLRHTNLRVIELDEKTLEAVQGGAGDWRPIWGKGRRGWYVDIGTSSTNYTDSNKISSRPRRLVHLPRESPKRKALQRLHDLNGVVSGDVGWHARKMEVLRGDGLMGREEGLYAFHSYQR